VELVRYSCFCRGGFCRRRLESGWHSGAVIAFDLIAAVGILLGAFGFVWLQESQYAVARVLIKECIPLA
jgi:hypothetical protein